MDVCVVFVVRDESDDAAALAARLGATLPAAEVARVAPRVRAADRANSLIAAHLLRSSPSWHAPGVVPEPLQMGPVAWRATTHDIVRPPRGGKPFLSPPTPNGDVNASHHGAAVAVASAFALEFVDGAAARGAEALAGSQPGGGPVQVGIDILDTRVVASTLHFSAAPRSAVASLATCGATSGNPPASPLRPEAASSPEVAASEFPDILSSPSILRLLHPAEIESVSAARNARCCHLHHRCDEGCALGARATPLEGDCSLGCSVKVKDAMARQFAIAWSRKEALGKAIGCGIIAPWLKDVNLLPPPDDVPSGITLQSCRETAGPWLRRDETPTAGVGAGSGESPGRRGFAYQIIGPGWVQYRINASGSEMSTGGGVSSSSSSELLRSEYW